MKIHIFSQLNSGIGQTSTAALLGQYYQGQHSSICLIDANPFHKTLFAYKGLPVKLLNIMEGTKIDTSKIPDIFEDLPNVYNMIIDVDAGIAQAFYDYIKNSNILGKLKEQGCEVIFHYIIPNSHCYKSSIKGLEYIADTFANNSIIVWYNSSYFYAHEIDLNKLEIIKTLENQNRLLGIIELPKIHEGNLHRALNKLVVGDIRYTINEASDCPKNISMEEFTSLLDFKKESFSMMTRAGL